MLCENRFRLPRGAALLAALLVLVLLGTLASLVFLSAGPEGLSAARSLERVQAELLERSALEHLRAQLAAGGAGAWPAPGQAGPFAVTNSEGRLIGRYALRLLPAREPFAWQDWLSPAGWRPRTPATLAAPEAVLSALKAGAGNPKDQQAALRAALLASDALDANHALQEREGCCGLEAVDFAEILSDDRSQIRFAYRADEVYGRERAVLSAPYFFGRRNYDESAPTERDDPAARETFSKEVARRLLPEKCSQSQGRLAIALAREPLGGGTGDRLYQEWLTPGALHPAPGLWRNASLALYGYAAPGLTPRMVCRILDSDRERLYVAAEKGLWTSLTNGACRYAQLRGWVHSRALYSERPGQPLWLGVQDLQPATAYEVLLQDACFPVPGEGDPFACQSCPCLGASGRLQDRRETEREGYTFPYAGGRPQKSGPDGRLELLLTSSAQASPKRRNRLNSLHLRRPDIIALENASREPVSLAGWRLCAASGLEERTLALLPPEARLAPGARFYLADAPDLAARELGWQGLPAGGFQDRNTLFPLPRSSWGLDYRITAVREVREGPQWHTLVTCQGARWRKNDLLEEVAEFLPAPEGQKPNGLSPAGLRFPIEGGNSRDTVRFSNLRLATYAGLSPGQVLRLAGLPRHLEYAALTLKDEYGRVAARVRGTARPPAEQRIYSHVKKGRDWSLASPPFSSSGARRPLPFLDRPETAWARLRRFLEAAGEREAADLLAASPALTLDVRVRPGAEARHQGGWQPAFGRFQARGGRLSLPGAAWPPDFWQGQKLRILEGPLKGEVYVVTGSTARTVCVLPRSLADRPLPSGAVKAALGPGSPLPGFVAWRQREEGLFTFSNFFGAAGADLYLEGLCDGLRTSEFLEENRSARLRVRLRDWEADRLEDLPPVRPDKNDRVLLARLRPAHISPGGLLQLSLAPDGLNDPLGPGRAFFFGLSYAPPRLPAPGAAYFPARPGGLLTTLLDSPLELKAGQRPPGANFRLEILLWGPEYPFDPAHPSLGRRSLDLALPDPALDSRRRLVPASLLE